MWCHVLFFGFPLAGLLLFTILPWPVALALYLPLATISLGAGILTVRTLSTPATTGPDGLRHRRARVVSLEGNTALVQVDGELWRAVPSEGLTPGLPVVIVEIEGLRLHVRPLGAGELARRG